MSRTFLENRNDTTLFQLVGNCPACRDFVNKMCKGRHIELAVALRTTGGQPSGPGDLAILILDNFSKTASTVKSTDYWIDLGTVKVGNELVSSLVKTLQK